MKTGIIGCRGRMGTMLAEHLKAAGHEVSGTDLPLEAQNIAAACAGADIVLLCVPAEALEEVCRKVVPHLPPHCVLTDVTSVKVKPLRTLESCWTGPVAGTHPLFGPESQQGTVAITPAADRKNSDEAAGKLEELFLSLGWPTFRCTAEEHDRAVAAVQGVNYISTVAYFALLDSIPHTAPFLTPSFRRRREAALTMLTGDAALFAQLYAANPASRAAVEKFQALVTEAAEHPEELAAAARRALAISPDDKRQDDGKS